MGPAHTLEWLGFLPCGVVIANGRLLRGRRISPPDRMILARRDQDTERHGSRDHRFPRLSVTLKKTTAMSAAMPIATGMEAATKQVLTGIPDLNPINVKTGA